MEDYQCTAADLAADPREKLVIDLRSRAFYDRGTWPGAVSMPMDDPDGPPALTDKALPVYLICYTGMTADDYALQLRLDGFEAHSVLDGWRGCLLYLLQQEQ